MAPKIKIPCHCADKLCSFCKGKCCREAKAAWRVYRIDMQDLTGTPMCQPCAMDALESGLFRTEMQKRGLNI